MAKKPGWEGGAKDRAEDKAQAKKRGMTLKEWERSPADRVHDAKEPKGKGKK